MQTLTVEIAPKYLVLAHLHNTSKLRETALNFMAINPKAVCSSKDWTKMMLRRILNSASKQRI